MDPKSESVRSITHDMRNLLTAVRGHAELALRGLKADDPVREDVAHVVVVTAAVFELIDQLDGKSSSASLMGTRLDSTMVGMRRLLESLMPNVELELALGAPGVRVEAPKLRIERIVLNLAINARDAMDGKGSLTVTSEADDEAAIISVADSGPGFTEDALEHLFESGFTTKGDRGGSGHGLFALKGIIDDAGGSIKVESKAGEGATVIVRLPVASEEAAADLVRSVNGPAASGSASPSKPAKPVSAERPRPAAKPGAPQAKPGASMKPGVPARSSAPPKTGDPSRPGGSSKPTAPPRPGVQAKPGASARPDAPTKSGAPVRAGTQGKPTVPAKPGAGGEVKTATSSGRGATPEPSNSGQPASSGPKPAALAGPAVKPAATPAPPVERPPSRSPAPVPSASGISKVASSTGAPATDRSTPSNAASGASTTQASTPAKAPEVPEWPEADMQAKRDVEARSE